MADLTITSQQELEAWLEDKPREWAQAIALRTVLRVLPVVLDAEFSPKEEDRRDLVLVCLRATTVSSGDRKMPAYHRLAAAAAAADAAYTAARQAAYSVAARDAASAAAAVAATSYAAIANTSAGPTSAAAAAATAYAASDAAAAAYADTVIWSMIARDCELLADGEVSSDRLLTLHVWPDAPAWFVESWERGRNWLRRSNDGFAIWAEWYERRIEGKSAFSGFDDEADNAFYRYLIDQDDVWWKREPAEINREIAAKVEELGGYTGGGSLSESEVRDILERTADPQAAVVDGKITIRANKDFGLGAGKPTVSLANQLVDLARLLADGLEDNAPRALKAALNTYAVVLEREKANPPSDTLDPAAGVVRKLHRYDGHDSWAKGLDDTFATFLEANDRLFGRVPEEADQARARAQIEPNKEMAATHPLIEDVKRFQELAEALRDQGVTDATARRYFDAVIRIGMEIAYGGPELEVPDNATGASPENWSVKDRYRANVAGLSLQMESQIALALSVSAHPQFQAVLPMLTDFAAHMLRFFV
ncbi:MULTISPECIES: hypothetical protein [Citromicrobium]|uniref:hypothetical protein n=1 Tax=Citromicrobium TaxID=72173 RepID=UPI0001DD0D38|nr:MULTISPECIES: hypothetical protein [Citromicrobium]ALG61806.1 hypothetical protein WG74_13985 [Citromicrobium sp. JL477]KPM15556.1 hypothetical protein VM77_12230 [Citromicrobium sp. JL31]KPM16463.1 hypothetical protein VO58_08265 [Citromicrobium sp. JL1351]KPM21833.1 hypothetical protein VO57_13215 [Citromicrobium sp. JL2201]